MKKSYLIVLLVFFVLAHGSDDQYSSRDQSATDPDVASHPLYQRLLNDGILEEGIDNTAVFNRLLNWWDQEGNLDDLLNKIIDPQIQMVDQTSNAPSKFTDPEIFLNVTNPHGIVIAPDKRIWVLPYAATETIGVDTDGDNIPDITKPCRAIYCYDDSGIQSDFSPIKVINYSGRLDTLWNNGRGLALGHDGSILASYYSNFYRLDYHTGACTGWLDLSEFSYPTEAACDANGNIYISAVAAGYPIKIFNNDLDHIGNVQDNKNHISRSLVVTPDGKDVYSGAIYSSTNGVYHYHSDNGSSGPYEFQEILGTDGSYSLWAQSLDWGPDHNIWVGTYWNVSLNDPNGWYSLNPSSGLFEDSIGMNLRGNYSSFPLPPPGTNIYSPRGIAWQNDNQYAYTADFEGHVIKKWRYIQPSQIYLPEISHDFNQIEVGETKSWDLLITNRGDDTLVVSDISWSLSVFSLNDTYAKIAAGDTFVVQVSFSPEAIGEFSDTLYIQNSDTLMTVIKVSLHGEGWLAPHISVSPQVLSDSLVTAGTSSQTVTIENTGEGFLDWSIIPAYQSLSKTLAVSPQYQTPAYIKSDSDIPELSAVEHLFSFDEFRFITSNIDEDQTDIDPTIITKSPPSIEEALQNLNLYYKNISRVIPNRYDFTEGENGYAIEDGGKNMYSYGNQLFTNRGPIQYSNDVITTNYAVGPSGKYFTRKYPGLFVFTADLDNISLFRTDGYLGADGDGTVDGAVLQVNFFGNIYYGFVKRVYEASTPSVNHLIIIPETALANHEFSTYTFYDYHNIFNLEGTERLYYLLFAGQSGYYFDNDAFFNIMNEFLHAIDAIPSWLSASPDSGRTDPGSSLEVAVNFDASFLPGGNYLANLLINSNDPDAPVVTIPAALHITGAPNISSDSSRLDFGEVFLNDTSTLELVIKNNGTKDLLILSTFIEPEEFTIQPEYAGVDVGETEIFTINFLPKLGTDYQGTVVFNSNDPDQPQFAVNLFGKGVEPPVISVTPDLVFSSLFTNELDSHLVTIHNNGGSDLNFTIEFSNHIPVKENLATKTPKSNKISIGYAQISELDIPIPEKAPVNRLSTKKNLSANTNYVWKLLHVDPDEPEIQHDVKAVYGCLADGQILFKLVGYTPWFEGEMDESVLWIFIDADKDVTTGENLFLELYGFDLGADYYIFRDGGWSEVGYWNEEYYLFDFLDTLTTNIVEKNSNELIIGIKESYFSDCQSVNFILEAGSFSESYTDLVPDMNQPVINFPLMQSWIRYSIFEGTVAADSSLDFTVTFDATDLFGGDYNGLLSFQSNDPVKPDLKVPVHLAVTGVPMYFCGIDTLNFITTFAGYKDSTALVIENPGTDTLEINQITLADSCLSVSRTTLTIAPRTLDSLQIYLSSSDPGKLVSELIFNTNDHENPEVSIPVISHIIMAPDIAVFPASIEDSVELGKTATHPLMIKNLGFSDLKFSIMTQREADHLLNTKHLNSGQEPLDWNSHQPSTQLNSAPRVLLVCDEGQYGNSAPAAKLALTSTGLFSSTDIDILKDPYTISTEILEPYDVVLAWSNYSFYDPLKIGNILKKFVDDGGGVVLAMNLFNNYYRIDGGMLDPNYSPFLPVYSQSVSGEINYNQISDSDHPVFTGISSNLKYWTDHRYSNPVLNTGGVILANDTWGNKVIAENPGKNIVGITIFPGMLADVATNKETRRMFANALYYVWKDNWLTISVNEGTVAAGDSMDVDITLNPSLIIAGGASTHIWIISNDPDEQLIKIPITLEVPTGISSELAQNLPVKYELSQNYPNPFNPITHIRFALPRSGNIKLEIYNIIGQRVKVLIDEFIPAGFHDIDFDGSNFASGIYYYRFLSDEFSQVKKMILIK